MFLIVGLGNIGQAYARTRHNVGFLFADYFARRLEFSQEKEKFCSSYCEKLIAGEKFVLQKPRTFMNSSGIAVSEAAGFYRISTQDILVVHDDIDLDFGEVRIKFAGGNGGHNGLRSIDQYVGKDYWRVRIGVGRPLLKDEVARYVLSEFSFEEIEVVLPGLFLVLSNGLLGLLQADEQDRANVASKIVRELKNR